MTFRLLMRLLHLAYKAAQKEEAEASQRISANTAAIRAALDRQATLGAHHLAVTNVRATLSRLLG